MGKFKDHFVDLPINCGCPVCFTNRVLADLVELGIIQIEERPKAAAKPKDNPIRQYGSQPNEKQVTSWFYEEARKRGLMK